MKALKLQIQAFGPFAQSQQIDFRRLGENPLFLINGATGAGKSSILDAICFALYGETTTEQRDASSMRCDQAGGDLLTEVTLDFMLAHKHYRVTRTPQQQRPKARGDGMTTQQAAASLWQIEDDGSETLLESRKVKEVNQQIEALTGLKVDQFRQVMVLPQGKFRQWLLASSSEREAIFSQLFQTSIYKRIEDRLKQQSAQIRKQVEAHHSRVEGLLKGAEVTSTAEIDEKLQSIKQPLQQAEIQKQQAYLALQQAEKNLDTARQTIQRFDQLAKTRQQYDALLAQKSTIEQHQQRLKQAQLADRIMPQFEQMQQLAASLDKQHKTIEQSEKELQHIELRCVEAAQHREQAQQAFAAVDDLKRQLDRLQQIESRVKKLQITRQQAKASADREQQLQQQVTAQRNQLDQQQAALKQKQQQREQWQQQITELSRCEVEKNTLQERLLQRKNLAQLEQEQADSTAQLEGLVRQIEQQQAATDSAQNHAREVEMNWHTSQAFLLARELETHQPCPVCGSTEHPAPAHSHPQQSIVERTQVDQARARWEQQRDLLEKLKRQHGKVEQSVALQARRADELTQALADLADASLAKLQSELDLAQQNVDKLNQLARALQSLQQPLLDLAQQNETLQNQLQKLQQDLAAATTQAIQDQSALDHILGEIPEAYREPHALAQAQQQCRSEIERLTEALDRAEKQYKTREEKRLGLTAALQEQRKQLKHSEANFATAQDAWQQALADSSFAQVEVFEQARLGESQQQVLIEQIDTYQEQLNTLQGRMQQQQEILADQSRPDLSLLEQHQQTAKLQYTEAEQNWRKFTSRQEALQSVSEKLAQENKTYAELEQQYAIYGTLSNVASGRHHHKISLQRFVLGVLLDDVLLQASQRLSVMSSGRYQLLRRDTRSKGNAASGLELDVEDAYTGKTRPVATLSGGESFMAALSLALGLSDVVQAYAGGIRLDMLFIDEGFGSLDQESLDLAMRTLIDLQSGGRMIGIISHVAELKEQMALRIDVSSTRNGSHISLTH